MHPRGKIERYLTEGLAPPAEARLRAHLRECADCRGFYDQQTGLLRALAGRPGAPTVAEERRAERLALAAITPRPVPDQAKPWREILQLHRWQLASTGAAIVVLIAVVALLWPRTPAAPITAARVVKANGVTLAGRPAVAGDLVLAGAELAAGSEGYAEIAVERGGVVRLFPGAVIRLDGPGESVALAAGKVWCVVDKGKGEFRVTTDRAVARVLGTSFVVERMPEGDTEVRVMSGAVAVEDSGHHALRRVSAGQKTRVGRDAAPSLVTAYSGEGDSSQWSLLELFKSIGRAIKHLFGK